MPCKKLFALVLIPSLVIGFPGHVHANPVSVFDGFEIESPADFAYIVQQTRYRVVVKVYDEDVCPIGSPGAGAYLVGRLERISPQAGAGESGNNPIVYTNSHINEQQVVFMMTAPPQPTASDHILWVHEYKSSGANWDTAGIDIKVGP